MENSLLSKNKVITLVLVLLLLVAALVLVGFWRKPKPVDNTVLDNIGKELDDLSSQAGLYDGSDPLLKSLEAPVEAK